MSGARAARVRAGLSVEAAATAARISARYLAQIELRSPCAYVLARRLAHLYGCSIGEFLPIAGGSEPARSAGLGRSRGRRRLQ